MRMVLVGVAVALMGLLATVGVAQGQEGEDVTPADVEAAFGDLTRADVEAMGYVVDEACISAEAVGAPAALGAMGFHAINESLVDGTLDPLEPEAVLLDADDNVIAVEYVADPNSGLSVLGQDLVFVPPIGQDALHVWFLDNPNGQFADFNPNVSCPAAITIPSTGTGGYVAGGGSGTAIFVALLLGIAGAAAALGGIALRRVTSR